MKAIYLDRFGSAQNSFSIQDVMIPEPGKGEVRIKVETFGLNFADVMARKGLYRDTPPLPAVLGYEVVGTIDKTGEGVDSKLTGSKVIAFTRFGGYAEYVVTDVRAVVPLPEGLDNGQATALSTQYCTAYFAAITMGNIRHGETVLIHAAAGGVGIALTQLAKDKGCTVIGTAGSEEKIDYIAQHGVDIPINYRKVDFAEKILADPSISGVDVIFDPVGGKSVKKGRQLLNAGGRLITFGASDQLNHRKGIFSSIKLLFDFGFLHPVGLLMKSTGVIGVNMLVLSDQKPELMQEILQTVVSLATSKKILPVVGREYRAAQIAEAHEFLESRKSIGKIVLHWD